MHVYMDGGVLVSVFQQGKRGGQHGKTDAGLRRGAQSWSAEEQRDEK